MRDMRRAPPSMPATTSSCVLARVQSPRTQASWNRKTRSFALAGSWRIWPSSAARAPSSSFCCKSAAASMSDPAMRGGRRRAERAPPLAAEDHVGLLGNLELVGVKKLAPRHRLQPARTGRVHVYLRLGRARALLWGIGHAQRAVVEGDVLLRRRVVMAPGNFRHEHHLEVETQVDRAAAVR